MSTALMIPMDPDKGKLSPYAPPFYPSGEPANLCIFNDGIPSFVIPPHDAAQGISDEALDEAFPPDAQEAAELEAVQHFVETLAILSFLEEREEAARNSFTGVKKRWESRRAEGLVGRPHGATHLVNPKVHAPHVLTAGATSNSTAMMTHGHAHKMQMKEAKMLQVAEVTRRAEPRPISKITKGTSNQRLPIQQPRKQN